MAKRRPAPVMVTTADGESKVRAASSFRRRARKKKPRLPLTRDQRAELFNGGHPRIVLLAGHRPFEPGDVYELPGSTSVWLGIIGVRELEAGEGELAYKTFDERPRLLRASVHGVDFEAIRRSYNDEGQPRPPKDQGEIDDAAEESAYTSSPGAALTGAAEEIHRAAFEGLTKQEREEKEARIRHKIIRAHEAIGAMEEDDDFKAHASSIRFLHNQVRKLEEQLLSTPAAVA